MLYGKGLPTLLTKGVFSFHSSVTIDDTMKQQLENNIAIDIINNIIENKLSNKGIKNRLYFLNSRTGSGKSTTFIYNLFNKFIRGKQCRLLTTEPRVPLCEANANEIIRWTDYSGTDKIGDNVGYLTGQRKVYCSSNRGKLYYMTPQILANYLNDMIVDGLSENDYIKIIVIDEAHLLDMPTLETLNILYNFMNKYKNDMLCPLVIFTSATLKEDDYIKYFFPLFEIKDINEIYKDKNMIGYVSGLSNFEVKLQNHDKSFINNLYNNSIENIDDLNKNKHAIIFKYSVLMANYIFDNYFDKIIKPITADMNGNDLLLFVAKKTLIKNITNELFKLVKTKIDNVFLVSKDNSYSDIEHWRLSNSLSTNDHPRVLIVPYSRGYSQASDEILNNLSPLPNERKIFVSTPIIETGKTIPTLRYCLDTGLELKPCPNPLVYNPYKFMDNLKIIPINKSAATQRLGRVGREQIGECMRLYTVDDYNKLEESEQPETVNNYCLSPVMLSKIQTLQPFTHYDIINDNNYLFKISVDIMVRSICDLINSGFYSIFGFITNEAFNIGKNNALICYIQQLYYINGLSLFDALLTINLNMKFISNELTPLNLSTDYLPYQLNEVTKLSVIDADIFDAIKTSRNTITLVLYDPSYKIFKNIYNRLF